MQIVESDASRSRPATCPLRLVRARGRRAADRGHAEPPHPRARRSARARSGPSPASSGSAAAGSSSGASGPSRSTDDYAGERAVGVRRRHDQARRDRRQRRGVRRPRAGGERRLRAAVALRGRARCGRRPRRSAPVGEPRYAHVAEREAPAPALVTRPTTVLAVDDLARPTGQRSPSTSSTRSPAVRVAAVVQTRDRLLARVAALREADRAGVEPRLGGEDAVVELATPAGRAGEDAQPLELLGERGAWRRRRAPRPPDAESGSGSRPRRGPSSSTETCSSGSISQRAANRMRASAPRTVSPSSGSVRSRKSSSAPAPPRRIGRDSHAPSASAAARRTERLREDVVREASAGGNPRHPVPRTPTFDLESRLIAVPRNGPLRTSLGRTCFAPRAEKRLRTHGVRPGPPPARPVSDGEVARPACRGTVTRSISRPWVSASEGEVERAVLAHLGRVQRSCRGRRSTQDIHCVTRWSRFDADLRGRPTGAISRARAASCPSARFAIAHAEQGYTANVPARRRSRTTTRCSRRTPTASR